jgi:hypothetical protein
MNIYRAKFNAAWAAQTPEPVSDSGRWWRKFMLSGGVDRLEWKAAREAACRALRMTRFDCLEKLEEVAEELRSSGSEEDVEALLGVERELRRLRRLLGVTEPQTLERRRRLTLERMRQGRERGDDG